MSDINSTISSAVSLINESDTNLANQLLSKVPFIGNNHALQALFLLLVFVIIAKSFLFVSKKIIRKITKKTKFEWDDKLLDLIERPIAIVIVLIGTRLAIIPLNIEDLYKAVISHFVNSLIIIAAFYSLSLSLTLFIDIWAKNFAQKTKTKIDEQLLPLIKKTLKVILVLICALFILKEWGVNIGPLLASLGIAGIAIGLALQPTLSNIFAGIALIVDRNFKKGDAIEIDGISGVIEDIGLRTTRIKTFDNDIVTFPNNNISNIKITNHLQPDKSARFNIQVGVSYGTKIEKVKKIIYNEINKNKRILKEPKPNVLFSDMGDFALKFNVFCWVGDFNEKGTIKDELLTEIYNSLNKNKIEIPYPTTTVLVKKH